MSHARYIAQSLIATGHSAVVYRGTDTMLDRPVALKCAKEGLIKMKPQYMAVFAREAKHMASLEHPHIVPLYDYYESPEGPVIVMRCVPQTSCARLAQAGSRVTCVGEMARGIAEALDFCRVRGVAHRDVKPDNVLVESNGHVYLTDFGLAAPFDDSNQWSQPIGTKPFISPELLRPISGDPASRRERSDQFSFGVLLYHLLAGAFPHDPRVNVDNIASSEWSDCTAYRLMSHDAPIPCSTRNGELPAQVDSVLARMLSVAPEDRYPSNVAGAMELEEAISGKGPKGVKLFVSYSKADKTQVSEYVRRFEQLGIQVWWDSHIDYGAVWEDEIERAMIECDVMLVVVSVNSVASQEVKNEWRYWLNCRKKPLITLVLDETSEIPYKLYSLQHVFARARPVDAIAAELAAAARKQAARTQAPPVQPAGDESKPSDSRYLGNDLNVIRSLDIGDQLQLVSNSGYVPNGYRLTLPPELANAWKRYLEPRDRVPPPSEN